MFTILGKHSYICFHFPSLAEEGRRSEENSLVDIISTKSIFTNNCMDKFLALPILNIDPDSENVTDAWNYWKRRFESFVQTLTDINLALKFKLLLNLSFLLVILFSLLKIHSLIWYLIVCQMRSTMLS
ncbi:hypothetical protein GJ496_003847 [Pomphorhynchus laevis]|nr:hypothetical protein GJ496_003847 [Pomphorhynchus laevis]